MIMPVPEQLDLPCQMEALQVLAMRAERFAAQAGVPQRVSFALQLCLEEATSNVIRHGGLAGDATVSVSLAVGDGHLVAEIADRGVAFDPLQALEPPKPTTLEAAAEGGRGIALMRRFCPDISYSCTAGTNRLRLAFALDPPPR